MTKNENDEQNLEFISLQNHPQYIFVIWSHGNYHFCFPFESEDLFVFSHLTTMMSYRSTNSKSEPFIDKAEVKYRKKSMMLFFTHTLEPSRA